MKVFLVSFLVFFLGAFVISGCKKKGCTDSNAKNYCDECKKDDGSCVYITASDLLGNWTQSGNCGTSAVNITGSGSSITFNNLFNNC